MKTLKKGDRVMMSQSLIDGLAANGCKAHADEFCECIGIVEDRCFPELSEEEAPEWNVRWQPSGLKYGYFPEDLTDLKEIRKNKINEIKSYETED